MKKLAITVIGFALLSVGFMLGVASNIGFASHLEKTTVIRLEDVRTDDCVKYANDPWLIGPQHVTMKVDEAQGVKAGAEYAAKYMTTSDSASTVR